MSYWYPSFNGGVLVCTAHTSNVPTCTYIHTGLYIYEHTYTITHRGNWYSDCLMATYSWAPCTRLTDPHVHIHVHAYLYTCPQTYGHTHSHRLLVFRPFNCAVRKGTVHTFNTPMCTHTHTCIPIHTHAHKNVHTFKHIGY